MIGLDIGGARIGVAVSDPSRRLATPVETVPAANVGAAVARIGALCAAHGVGEIVVGLPVEMTGREGHAVRRTRRFTAALSMAVAMPIHEWDERLTSSAAERSLIESGVSRRDRKEVVDQAAAVLILQGWLDNAGRQ